MKKITNITEYPFITMIMNSLLEDGCGEWIKTVDVEETDKNFTEKYVGDNLEMDADLGGIENAYLNEGFLNGYIIATKILKGELM